MVQMKMAWGIRKHAQDAPELLLAVDEFTMDETPSWWAQALQKEIESWGSDYDRHVEIEFNVPYEAIMAALNPPKPRLAVSWLNQDQFQ